MRYRQVSAPVKKLPRSFAGRNRVQSASLLWLKDKSFRSQGTGGFPFREKASAFGLTPSLVQNFSRNRNPSVPQAEISLLNPYPY